MTRGCIAIGDLNAWQGIIIPSDAQAHSAGIEIRNYLRYQKDLFAFANELLTHPTWSSFKSKHIGGKDTFLGLEANRLTPENVNPLYIEHVYVIDPPMKQLHRFGSRIEKGTCVHHHVETLDLTEDEPPCVSIRPKDILDLRFREDEEGYEHGTTIREYMIKLFTNLWKYQADFNGKRPLGNSGWDYDLYVVLVRNGVVRGKLDPYGFVQELDKEAAFELILRAIEVLVRGD